MQTLIRRFFPAFAIGSMLFGTLAFAAVPALAAGPGAQFVRPVVFGKVTSVSGNTLTVTSQPPRWHTSAATTTTYTVDAASATVLKEGQTSSVSNISVGDIVAMQGTVSGTSVTATMIHDGKMGGRGMGMHGGWDKDGTSTPPAFQNIKGTGEPIIGGTVSAISGSTLTVTAKAGKTYTVSAASSTVAKAGMQSATLSNVSVGDAVVVQGAVNGSSVTASSIIDQAAAGSGGNGNGNTPPHHRFFGAIGGFFSRIFGFF